MAGQEEESDVRSDKAGRDNEEEEEEKEGERCLYVKVKKKKKIEMGRAVHI